jgi:hypothetical protein
MKYLQIPDFGLKIKIWLQTKARPNLSHIYWFGYSLSTPFISLRTGKAVDVDVYVKECMPQLKTFIQKYPNDQIIFWPHLASIYYGKKRGNGLMTTK